ncbi:hypothetical protein K2173_026674 [Erythroxylum novogranatense]|uniref:Bifunctional inhibitor/plant lipid transfer protein/seed storage helical domain-containing protein n=1 Tax=Erythroxylum novogranatense TaxID=1862640 RepID=A0AAV8TX43_9ROSI|nr:hypothetical protein K2173_026674 [Erythroxylum novogranatense]
MAALTSPISLTLKATSLLLLLVIALPLQTQLAGAQECSTQLNNLNVCAPFLVPGTSNPNPSPDCCNALQAVPQDCFCNTIQIAARLPSQCNIPPLNCPTS